MQEKINNGRAKISPKTLMHQNLSSNIWPGGFAEEPVDDGAEEHQLHQADVG